MHPGDDERLPAVLDADQTARHLHIHRETVYLLIRRGQLRGAKVGRRWRITREAIEELLAGDAA